MATKKMCQAFGRLVILSIVVCLLLPGLSIQAQDQKSAPAQADASARAEKEKQVMEKFDRAVELFNQGKYAEARQVLVEVRDSGVDLGYFKTRELNNYLQKAEEHLKKVPTPAPTEPGAKLKASEPPKEDYSALFDKGEALFKAGKLEDAKKIFISVRDSGVNLGFFKNRRLKKYLEEIDQKLAAAQPKPAPVATAKAAEKPAQAPTPAPKPEARPQPAKVAQATAPAKPQEAPKAPEPKPAPPAATAPAAPQPKPVAPKAPAPEQKKVVAAPPAKSQAPPVEDKTKAMTELYHKGLSLYGQGKYKEALDIFLKVQESGVNLGWWHNARLKNYINSARGEIQRQEMALATEQARKAQQMEAQKIEAEKQKARKELAEKAIEPAPVPEVSPSGPTAEQKFLAAKELFEKGLKLYSEERYAEARDVFKEVLDSGVSLGWWNNRRLKSYLADAEYKAREAKKIEAKLGMEEKPSTPAVPELTKAPTGRPTAEPTGSQEARARSFMEELARERQIKEQRDRALAEHYTNMGEKYYNEANYPKAREELEKALKLVPDLPKARDLYEKTLALLGVSENKVKDFAQKIAQEKAVKIEQKQIQMENRLREGVRLLKAEKYDEAIQAFEDVKTDLEFLKRDIDIAPYLDHVESLMELANKRKIEAEKQLAKQRKEQAARQAAEDEARQKEVSEEKLKTLYDQAYNAFVKRRFNEVQRICKDILELDPNNAAAEELKEQARLQQDKKTWEEIRKTDKVEHERNRQYLHKMKNPSMDLVGYPEKDIWEEITRRDPVAYPEDKQPTEKEAMLKQALKERRVDINFEATPLSDVVNFLRSLVDLNIVLDPNLEDKEIRERLISLQLSDITLGAALDFICGKDLIYIVKNDAILITTRAALQGELSIQVYDVRDLLLTLIDRPAQPFTLAEGTSGAAAAAAGGLSFGGEGGAEGGAGGGLKRSAKGRDLMDIDLQRRGHDLIELIVRVTGIQNWDHAFVVGKLYSKDYIAGEEGEAAIEQIAGVGGGGGEGAGAGMRTIAFRDGDLIIRQSSDIHEMVKQLLSRMRESMYIQVSIDARFLTVQDNWFEEVGTDITNLLFRNDRKVTFNPDNPWSPGAQGQGFPYPPFTTAPGGSFQLRTPGPPPTTYPAPPLPGQAGAFPSNRFLVPAYPNPNLTELSPVAHSGFWGISNPFNTAGPLAPFSGTQSGSIAALFPGGATAFQGVGLNLGLAFLSDIQAALLIKAVQDSNKADILSCPRVTVFNTQRANISVGRQVGYIADADVGNNGALDPQVASVTTRTTLDVRPIVSADRRYVYLELFPQTRALGTGARNTPDGPFFTVTVTAAAGTGNTTAQSSIPIQLPQQDFRIVETTVCVPDRGHLLIGGLATVSETDTESGIPVLNKLPLVKRLFSRRGSAKIRNHLLILIHPTILVKEELENKVY